MDVDEGEGSQPIPSKEVQASESGFNSGGAIKNTLLKYDNFGSELIKLVRELMEHFNRKVSQFRRKMAMNS